MLFFYANIIVYVLFLIGVFAAGIWDARERRIPNKLNLALFILGILHGFLIGEIELSLIGAGFAFFLAIFPALIMRMPVLRAVGGGDIKMMTAIGAFYGLSYPLFWVFAIGSILSVIYGLFRMAKAGYLKSYIILRPIMVLDVPETRVPFGVFLSLGIMIYETIMFIMMFI